MSCCINLHLEIDADAAKGEAIYILPQSGPLLGRHRLIEMTLVQRLLDTLDDILFIILFITPDLQRSLLGGQGNEPPPSCPTNERMRSSGYVGSISRYPRRLLSGVLAFVLALSEVSTMLR